MNFIGVNNNDDANGNGDNNKRDDVYCDNYDCGGYGDLPNPSSLWHLEWYSGAAR